MVWKFQDKPIRFLLWLIPFTFLFCDISSAMSQDPPLSRAPVYDGFKEISPEKNHFVIVGDTQRTSSWEFWRERNDRERKLIIDEIARRDPAIVVHLGDLITRGSSKKQWQEFDDMNKAFREKRIPYFPILGNHDLYGSDKKALHSYFERFPDLNQRRWYSFTWKNVGWVMLDSNFSSLTTQHIEEQIQWYLKELGRFEKDVKLDHIFVCCHEPPFTNSRVVRPNEKVKAFFADPFLKYSKTRFFFSGHSHSYERFQREGKFFVVSGGGGGPRHKLSINREDSRCNDLFKGAELRFFHFIEVEIIHAVLYYKVLSLESDGGFAVVDPLSILQQK
jgi:predicted phosphodiesterase